ncbi:putative glycosyl transferase family 10 [Helianthus annuus]|nr:putative glycosyl transferase family 10 [Helianthus annuus]
MSFLNPNHRPSRSTTSVHHLPTSSVASSSSSSSSSSLPLSSTSAHNSRKKWTNLLPLFLVLVFIAEISFLGRLDLTKNADLLNSWTESFYQFTTSSFSSNSIDSVDEDSILGVSGAVDLGGGGGGGESCEEWLERVDSVVYGRDFKKEPVLVTGAEQLLKALGGTLKVHRSRLWPRRKAQKKGGPEKKKKNAKQK